MTIISNNNITSAVHDYLTMMITKTNELVHLHEDL